MKKNLHRFATAIGGFVILELLMAFLFVGIFQPGLLSDLFSKLWTIFLYILVGLVVFIAGYITCLVPYYRFTKLLKGRNKDLASNISVARNLIHQLKADKTDLQAKNAALSQEVTDLKSELSSLKIMRTAKSVTRETTNLRETKNSAEVPSAETPSIEES